MTEGLAGGAGRSLDDLDLRAAQELENLTLTERPWRLIKDLRSALTALREELQIFLERCPEHPGSPFELVCVECFESDKTAAATERAEQAEALLAQAQQERAQAIADVIRMAMTKVGEKCEHHKESLNVLEYLALRECPICWQLTAREAEKRAEQAEALLARRPDLSELTAALAGLDTCPINFRTDFTDDVVRAARRLVDAQQPTGSDPHHRASRPHEPRTSEGRWERNFAVAAFKAGVIFACKHAGTLGEILLASEYAAKAYVALKDEVTVDVHQKETP